MLVIRKERETNQQVLRRFNRQAQTNPKLQKVREKQFFVKEVNRFARLRSALRRDLLRRNRQWY
jgi:ribosomal protein S21